MVVNYKPVPIGPLLFFLAFVVVCMIGMPVWEIREFGVGHSPFGGKLILAPIIGVAYLALVVRTFTFNARVRRDPRAIQWNSGGISLWQNGRQETVPWSSVSEIGLKGRSADRSYLRIVTSKPGGGVMRWLFSPGRLQLAGQSLPSIARLIDQARGGQPVIARAPVVADAAAKRRSEKVDRARGIVVIITSVYFVTLIGMLIYLSSSHTTLLTPHDPLLWLSAKCAFFATLAAWSVGYFKTVWDNAWGAWRVVASFLPGWLFVAFGSAAMMGVWAYLAANVYVTQKTWGGHVEHGAVLMVAEPWVSHHGRPAIHAHLINRPGQDVYFMIADADKKSMDQWYRPDVPEDRACVTVPVEWAGYAIRAEVTEDDILPPGSVTGCS